MCRYPVVAVSISHRGRMGGVCLATKRDYERIDRGGKAI